VSGVPLRHHLRDCSQAQGSYVPAEPYSSADFLHGPIAIVEEGFPVIVVAPRGRTYDDVCRLARDLRGKAAELVVISDQKEALALATTPFPLPVSRRRL
jgi:glucosamine--fructose-6-phosphate aminotransferase (isomerizing)